ncbi:MAG: S-adenosylmethionine:tRNA ribosyltransferase-isomerase [Flavobacteriales bacterium]|jgi:S-adenosylmethionine:tRNA ribosyltransferase-isomerase|tara:strand:+ start:115 stop:1305 length:1191 start_codon:yes stop_codon:yes gene_type:complete
MKVLEYQLPEERIAWKPKDKRSDAKLLCAKAGNITDEKFSDISKIIGGKHHLILNETKVVNARLHLRKVTGGVLEVFCLEPAEGDITEKLAQTGQVEWRCLLGGAKKWKEGFIVAEEFYCGNKLQLKAEKIGFFDGAFKLAFSWSSPKLSFSEILEIFGKTPLPPYIKRSAETSDVERYQTVFAKNEGSVAAPTASLHFTEEVFGELEQVGVEQVKVSLHVGAGTFKPISSSVEEHIMHHELFDVHIDELRRLSVLENLIAVGTTAVRTVESLFVLAVQLKQNGEEDLAKPQIVRQWDWKSQPALFKDYHEAFSFLVSKFEESGVERVHGYTSLMIVPGFKFKVITGLITNFHMPKSTLLFLVSAFIGESWREVYSHALENDYRFLSYGDSSLLIP